MPELPGWPKADESHWREEVKAGLDRDVRLGVLEKVPLGTPVTWCHRMVICAKKNRWRRVEVGRGEERGQQKGEKGSFRCQERAWEGGGEGERTVTTRPSPPAR